MWHRIRPDLADCLHRAMQGDQPALSVLLASTSESTVERIARRVPPQFRGQFDAADLVQEAHVVVFQRIKSFRGSDARQFERWVCAIAVYKLRRWIRTARALKRGGARRQVADVRDGSQSAVSLLDWLQGPGRTASRSVARAEAIELLRSALEALPADYRDALKYIYFENLSVAEAAARMNRTDRAVHNLCFKARQQLRDLLGPGMSTQSTWA